MGRWGEIPIPPISKIKRGMGFSYFYFTMKYYKSFKTKLQNFWNWYILGEYHCDKCPYSWCDMSYDGEINDCGCYRFGDLRDSCRHLRNPISQLIVNKHKNENDDQWSHWIDYGEQYEICDQIYNQIIDDVKNGFYVPPHLIEFTNKYDMCYGTAIIMEIVSDYNLLVNPYKTPSQKLKESFVEWKKDFIYNNFKCYFRKK